jgi:hypothetical protein
MQLILSKRNILSYASNTLSQDIVKDKLYIPTKIFKVGDGIKNNEIIQKAKGSLITKDR